MDKKQRILSALESKNCLKVIAGINNFDKVKVMQIAAAASQAKATLVDICAQEDIVLDVLNANPDLAVMVSSVEPQELHKAAVLGAHALELGNFEVLYAQGIYYSAAEVMDLTVKTLELLATKFTATTRPVISITVPGHLEISEQVNLAQDLEALNIEGLQIDVIQTEGAALVEAKASGALGQIEKVRLTLANTMELVKSLERLSVLTASAISPDTAPLAIAAGANGVGVGKYVSKLETSIEMLAAVTALTESLNKEASVNTQEFANIA